MNVGVVVQARLSSSRLPGKVLRPLAGRPAIQYLLDGLKQSRFGCGLCVATSSDATDDPLSRFCTAHAISCFRGSLENVAERCLRAAESHGWDAFARISGDSPLLDYRLVDQAADQMLATRADLVSNVFPRTFPPGQSVEVIRTDVMRSAIAQMELSRHREHVSTWFYEHSALYRIVSVRADVDRSNVHLALDTPADRLRIESILERLPRPHWTYTVYELLDVHDQLVASGKVPQLRTEHVNEACKVVGNDKRTRSAA